MESCTKRIQILKFNNVNKNSKASEMYVGIQIPPGIF